MFWVLEHKETGDQDKVSKKSVEVYHKELFGSYQSLGCIHNAGGNSFRF